MVKCKWAGDVNDEYCKSCNGITMEVDGNSISCAECAGYEAGEEDAISDDVDMTPTEADKRVVDEAAKKLNKDSADTQQNAEIKSKTTTTKGAAKKPQNKEATTVSKVKEEKKSVESGEEVDGEFKVTSMRYTSGATIKRGDNYFKFIAEEEWDVSQAKQDVQDIREQLWAKLNAEVDSQIEELNNME